MQRSIQELFLQPGQGGNAVAGVDEVISAQANDVQWVTCVSYACVHACPVEACTCGIMPIMDETMTGYMALQHDVTKTSSRDCDVERDRVW
jgi:hypothetical protein